MGKTRLVLEATRRWAHKTVFITSLTRENLGQIKTLQSPDKMLLVVIDDPHEIDFRKVIDEALAQQNIKVIITVPTLERIELPPDGNDRRICFAHLTVR